MNGALDIIGEDRAARVRRLAGGTRISIPSDIDSSFVRGSSLEDRFGREIAILLVFHFPGRIIYVPRGEVSSKIDDRKVVRLTLGNLSARKIARKLKCSERSVYAARARAKEKGLLPY